MSPDVRSRLTRSAAADGGAVHGDVTWATCSELRSWSTIWLPAASRSAVDAVGRRNDDQQLHVASMELLGQEPSRRGRLCRRILESTGGQTLRYGNSEYPQGDGQQHREYDDASRCGNGQQGDPMQ